MKRKEAIKQGLTHYQTGKACKRGHVAKRTSKDGVCVECATVLTQEWQDRNKSRYATYQQEWRENNSEYERDWRLGNPGRRAAIHLRRRTALRQRTPAWLTSEDKKAIDFFYENRPEGAHVDHIVPLNGKTVSGLHVPSNLQWLPAAENLAKGNSYGGR